MFSLLGRPRGIAAFAPMIAIVAASEAHAQEAFVSFDIRAQPLSAALLEFSRQADIPVGVDPALVNGKSAPAVQGSMAPTEALNRLLAGSGLTASRLPEGGFVLAQAPARLGDAAQAAPRETAYGEIVVTGTRIKGVSDQFSPVTQIGRDEMDLAGYANASDVFDDLPQNFGGGASLDTITAANQTGAGGSSVNLRGLGLEATLILLNGRRLAPGGVLGDFVDISAIPTSAIDRIEVVTDGASAIYGSDAIAGVVNIILREDFSGAESRLNLSTITDGGGDTIKIGQTFGFSGDRAHGLVTYEYGSEEELNTDDKDFAAAAPDPSFLLPFSQKHNVVASGGIHLSDRIGVTADAYYNWRKSKSFASEAGTFPFSFFAQSDVRQLGGAASVNLSLFRDWEADISGAYSESVYFGDQRSLRSTTGSCQISDAKAEIASADISVGGSLFQVTDEAVRAIVGVHYRSETADQLAFNPGTGQASLDVVRSRDVFAAYGEIYAPLVSDSDGIPGIERLAITAALRYDDYSDVGSSLDPKVGAVWSPFAGLNVRGTYGTSFRVPRLTELQDLYAAVLDVWVDPESPSGETVAIWLTGTRSDLDPEQAESWTVGFDLEPPRIEGFSLRGTYFNTVYDNRIGRPFIAIDSSFRLVGFTGSPIRNPSPQAIQELIAAAALFSDASDFFPSLGDLRIEDVTAILDTRVQNTIASKVDGFDLAAAYRLSSDVGDWTFSLNSTLLTTFTQQVTPSTPVSELLNTFNNQVDLRLRGGVAWSTSPATVALYVNHVDGYTDNAALGGPVPVDSWTTMDASVRFILGEILGGELANEAALTLSVTNVFNEDPPAIGARAFPSVPYDPANADPAGRRVAVLLTKRW